MGLLFTISLCPLHKYVVSCMHSRNGTLYEKNFEKMPKIIGDPFAIGIKT